MIGNCHVGPGRIAAEVVIALLLLTGPAVRRLDAQGSAATILGTVTDSSGAAVPDAAVQVRNIATDIRQSTNSNAQGRFVIPDLGIGDYEVQATKMGFATVVHKGVTVTVGSQNVVDFALAVGQQSQTVTVDSQLSQVDVTNAALGSLIGGQQMSNLPINGRNFESLIMLSPGVQTVNTMAPNARQGRANVFSAAGARPEGFVLLMDDEVIDNFFRRGMGTITGSSLGMEAMAEFQTLTNTYGAQFGGNGAVMNAVSKSGSNQFHGSAYYFIRNSALDARGSSTTTCRLASPVPRYRLFAEASRAAVLADPSRRTRRSSSSTTKASRNCNVKRAARLCPTPITARRRRPCWPQIPPPTMRSCLRWRSIRCRLTT